MLDIFSGLRLVVKRRSISIDNAIFRCHWFFTSTLLVSFSLIITARQYVGQPIECHSVNKIPDSLLNSYCWVQSTFTVPQACNQQVGVEVPYPCIDNTRGRDIKMFAYYQWVGMVLFVQGLLFHLPYYLWKVWENGLIRAITGGLRVAVLSDQERVKKRDIVVDYIQDHLGCHRRYAMKYFICELTCLLNLMGQLWATNKFFDGQFLRYGIEVMHYSSTQLGLDRPTMEPGNAANATLSPQNIKLAPARHAQATQQQAVSKQVDPMSYIFPRITKCTYYDFGSSGDIQKHDALCLLPLNIINEKIYIALWFWFLVLAILTILVIIYRVFAIMSEQVRCKGLISRCKLSSEHDIRVICKHCDVGDWFLFYMVAENLDPLIMREIVASVADRIRQHFELKQRLTSGPEQPLADAGLERQDSVGVAEAARWQPFGLAFGRSRRDSQWAELANASFETESSMASAPSTRRSSLADDAPLVRKLKKRLYNKRLWSAELCVGELRQAFSRQPATNPETHAPVEQTASAPPATEMANTQPLAPLLLLQQQQPRRGSLSSASGSAGSGSTSFVMDMGAVGRPASPARQQQQSGETRVCGQRRLSASSRTPLRHRLAHQHHVHHSSITSIRELQSPTS